MNEKTGIEIDGEEVVIYKPERMLKEEFLKQQREELKYFKDQKEIIIGEIQKRIALIKQITGKEE